MKLIQKSREPNSLLAHRGIAGTDYESFKTDVGLGQISPASGLRKLLLEDQGYICAYCMRRIPHSHSENGVTSDKMKIEHFVPQTKLLSITQKLDLRYSNMLACCMGNYHKDKKREEFETCDTRKGEADLTISPLNIAHIRTLKYASDGSIHSSNVTFENEIHKILNLNEDNLKKQRKAIFASIERRVKLKFREPYLTRVEKNAFLDAQINWFSSRKDGKLEEFCMVAISYLEKRKR